jgi:hypothetical protein
MKAVILKPNSYQEMVIQLFRDVAAFSWFGALEGQTARALGLNRQSLERIIRNPVYKGVIKLGEKLHAWEPYRLVDDELWSTANGNLLKTRKHVRRPNKVDELAGFVSDVWLVRTLVEHGIVLCPKCREQVHWSGVHEVRGKTIPIVACRNNHETPIMAAEKMEDVTNPQKTCWECGEARKSRFRVLPFGRGRRIRCVSCGWIAITRRYPFGSGNPAPVTGYGPINPG